MAIPKDLKKFFKKQNIKVEDIGENVRIRCPFHADDQPSLSIRKSDGIWYCFGCGYSGNFYKLLDQLGIEYDRRKRQEIDAISEQEWQRIMLSFFPKPRKKRIPKKEIKGIESVFNNKKCPEKYDVLKYMLNRGFLLETLKHFDLCFVSKETKWNQKYTRRALIPVYGKKKKLLWFEARSIEDVKDRKYYRTYKVSTLTRFYNYWSALEYAEKYYTNEVIVVEGVLDAMMLYQFGYNSIANFGVRLNDKKLSLLSAFDKVIFCFDNDKKKPLMLKGRKRPKTAQELQKEAMKKAKNRGYEVSYIKMPEGKDVCDITKEEFDKFYDLDGEVK